TEKSSGKKFVYYSDCKRIPREAGALATGADVVCLDGLRVEPHPTHMNIEEACAAAVEIGAPVTYLTHLTHGIEHEAWTRKLAASHRGIQLAHDGLRLKL
ncbi:MAG TPA: MBL fold metallo-hydrolase, partial [Lacunisphaera sp.]|nr:MBL fold metallo-hydrolase [Lacunisphaera sp.]